MKTSALRVQLAAFLFLSLTVLWAFTLAELQRRESNAIETAEVQTRGIAQAFAENALSTINRIDLILIELAGTWVTRPKDFVAEIQRHQRNIADVSIQVAVTDADGWLVFSNLARAEERLSLADREHIRAHFNATDSRLFISKPVLGRVSGKWSLQFTRPLLRDGKFDGVIVISVTPELFSRFYRALSLGREGITVMVRDSGDVLARAPEWEQHMGRTLSDTPYLAAGAPMQGNFRRTSQLDGVERLYGYYRLPEAHLSLVTGLSVDEILAPVDRQRRITVGITAAISLALIVMAQLILRSLMARERAETTLRQRTAELQDYRDHLEELVDSRTAELSVANAELRATNRQLGEAHSMLLQAEKMASLGQLAAGVAHEINNPIGFVNSNLGCLEAYFRDLLALIDVYGQGEDAAGAHPARVAETKRRIDFDYIREDLTQMLQESKDGLGRVKKIVQDLRSFAQIDAMGWQLVDLHAGLESTLNVAGNEIRPKAEVVRQYGALPEVECLPGEINQVFMNLLLNAAHAIAARGEIRIRTGCAGETVWVEISDTGCGIPPENLKRIFDPFFTTRPVGAGTGLGLSLAYAIVKKHHGHIEVQSTPGRGTTFRLLLPLRQQAASQALPA